MQGRDLRDVVSKISPNKRFDLRAVEDVTRTPNQKESDLTYLRSLTPDMDDHSTVENVKTLVTQEGLRDWLL
jgi:hypothetical protein